MTDQTAWPAGATFGELTPGQKQAAARRACEQLSAELTAAAPAIAAALDAADHEHEPGAPSGHLAAYAPEGDGYLVACPSGCHLGTSAHAADEPAAQRRVRLHLLASSR
jgi:hypothetical protein